MSSEQTATTPPVGEEPSERREHPVLRRVLALAPAAVTAVALLPLLPVPARATILTGGFLFAPGALLWWWMGGPLTRNLAGLPAVVFAFSFAALLPATVAFLFFGVTAGGIAWPVVAALAALGWIASSSRLPRIERPVHLWWVVPVLAVAVAALSRATDFDQLTHISMANFIKVNGHYPEINPFLIGDLPLAPRWRVNGWTGWMGALAHLADVGAKPLLTLLLPPIFVVVAASAIYLFASVLAGERVAALASFLGAVLFPLLWVVPEPIAQTRLWLSSAAQDKSVGLLVLLPVVMVVVLRLVDRPAPWTAGGGAALLLALFFVHPLMFVFAVFSAGMYLAVHAVASRALPLRAAAWLVLAVLPAGVLGLWIARSGPQFGISWDAVEVADVAVPRSVGPITVWEPFKVVGENPPDAPDGDTFFALKRLGFLGGVPARYMIIGGTVMPSARLLSLPIHAALIAACLYVCVRAPRGRLRSWIAASTVLALVPFLVPPAAWLVGKIATPWVLWRFIWLLPLPLAGAWLVERAARRRLLDALVAIGLVAVLATGFSLEPWDSDRPFQHQRVARRLTDESGNLMTPYEFANWTRLLGGGLRAVIGPSIRGPNNFPHDRLDDARHRELGVRRFFDEEPTLEERMEMLERYEIDVLLAKKRHVRRLESQGVPVTDLEMLPRNFVLFRVPVAEGD